MSQLPPCPKCNSEFTYMDGSLCICPECANEWSPELEAERGGDARVIKDANGNVLQDGDTVTVIKDLTDNRAISSSIEIGFTRCESAPRRKTLSCVCGQSGVVATKIHEPGTRFRSAPRLSQPILSSDAITTTIDR